MPELIVYASCLCLMFGLIIGVYGVQKDNAGFILSGILIATTGLGNLILFTYKLLGVYP